MVEFALLLPLFVLLVMGLADVALVTKTQLNIMQATREGARRAAVVGAGESADDTQIYDAIAAVLSTQDKDRITEIRIFKWTNAPGSVCQQGTEAPCEYGAYDKNGAAIGSSDWSDSTLVTDTQPTDSVGVRITYQYSGLFGQLLPYLQNLTLADQTVMRLDFHP